MSSSVARNSDGTIKESISIPLISGTVAAAGSTQGDATALAVGFNLVSAADGTKGVVLPTGERGKSIRVKNNASSTLKVYPPTSGTVNALAANTAMTMAANTSCEYVCYDGTAWYTIPLLPS